LQERGIGHREDGEQSGKCAASVSLERNRPYDSLGTLWSPVRRVLFRFLFSYLAMYCVELLAIATLVIRHDLIRYAGGGTPEEGLFMATMPHSA